MKITSTKEQRQNAKNIRKIQDMTFGQLDRFYKSCRIICKKWDKKGLPLETLKPMLDIIKVKDPNKEAKEAFDFINKYNNLVDSLYTTFEKASIRMNSIDVPLTFIKECINLIKSSYKQSV